MTSSTYNVALPVTLYAPDSNNLMTASADATMLVCGVILKNTETIFGLQLNLEKYHFSN